jgi:hypothetical protein
MRLITVKWGKLYIEMPAEIFPYRLFKAFLVLHSLNI